MIKIIVPALLIISLVSLIIFRINNQAVEDIPASQTTILKPSETPIPEASREGELLVPFEEPKVVSDQFVKVIFKEGTDITQFAKKYNIDATKIEGPSIAGVYRIPVPEGENIVSAIALFRKDPDVVSAKFELYAVPH